MVDIEKKRAYHRAYYHANKHKVHENRREYQRNYRRKQGRAGRLLQLYGLTLEAWETIFNRQGRKCACCGSTKPKYVWCTDHDHLTDQVRGILCHSCNTGIGKLGDTAEGVRLALEYLERSNHTGN